MQYRYDRDLNNMLTLEWIILTSGITLQDRKAKLNQNIFLQKDVLDDGNQRLLRASRSKPFKKLLDT